MIHLIIIFLTIYLLSSSIFLFFIMLHYGMASALHILIGNCVHFILNGHLFMVNVNVILGITTVSPKFDPVMISASIINRPNRLIIRWVPMHKPLLGSTFVMSTTRRFFFSLRTWGGISWLLVRCDIVMGCIVWRRWACYLYNGIEWLKNWSIYFWENEKHMLL